MLRNISAIGDGNRPETALAWLQQQLANGEINSVVVLTVSENEGTSYFISGSLRQDTLAFIGAMLTNLALAAGRVLK